MEEITFQSFRHFHRNRMKSSTVTSIKKDWNRDFERVFLIRPSSHDLGSRIFGKKRFIEVEKEEKNATYA